VIHVKTLMVVFIILLLLSSWYAIPYDPLRVSAFILMGLAMSAVSIIVYYRRLEFLTAESVHVSLFAVTLGYIVNYLLNIPVLLCAFIAGLLLIYSTQYMMYKGLSQEKSSAVIVSSTSAFSVMLMYYALTTMPARYSLSSIILGDPLLLTRFDSSLAIFFSIALFILVIIFIREIIETSIDPVSASLTGVKVKYYDVLTYTAIALASIGFLRLAGYVMEHVLMLLPAIASSFYSSSLKEHVVDTLLLGVSATATGFAASLLLNTIPTGLTGLILLLVFLLGSVLRREK